MRRILVDETSARRGHRCVTSVVDANTRELFLMAEGRGGETIAAFVAELRAPGGESAQIELVCIDLSAAYREGVRLNLPGARIVFDRIHLMQQARKAQVAVRQGCGARGTISRTDSGPCGATIGTAQRSRSKSAVCSARSLRSQGAPRCCARPSIT